MASKTTKVRKIGIIAEDDSDFLSIRNIVRRIAKKENLPCIKKVPSTGGCSTLRRKCAAWAKELDRAGCDLLVIVHDKDRLVYQELHGDLRSRLGGGNRYICIPVEELEAWFLSDPEGIAKLLKLDRTPKIKGEPETINSPKEYLKHEASACSMDRVRYLNTVYNPRLAESLSLDKMRQKCPTFQGLYQYLDSFKY